jgi:hypothetical protein
MAADSRLFSTRHGVGRVGYCYRLLTSTIPRTPFTVCPEAGRGIIIFAPINRTAREG